MGYKQTNKMAMFFTAYYSFPYSEWERRHNETVLFSAGDVFKGPITGKLNCLIG
jgi:hypothetical protein